MTRYSPLSVLVWNINSFDEDMVGEREREREQRQGDRERTQKVRENEKL